MILGLLAGAFGGWVDTVVMRIVDVMLSIPSLLLAISIGVLFTNPNLTSVIIAVSIPQIPVFARLLRGQMLAQRESDHVLAARALGVKRGPIVFRHMLPNSISPVIVQATLVVATSILDAAALSFLGLGSQDVSAPEWGQMLGEAQGSIDSHPQLAFWPAGAIIIVVLGFTLLGRGAARGHRPEEPAVTAMTALLEVEDLTVQFNRKGVAPFTAVDKVSFSVAPGQTVGLVGESGCGKSVTSLAIMRLLPKRGSTITGSVQLRGHRPAVAAAGRHAGPARPGPGDDLPGPAVLAEPGGAHRDSGHRGAGAAPRDEAVGGHARGPRPAGLGGHSGPEPAAQGVPASSSPAACGNAR